MIVGQAATPAGGSPTTLVSACQPDKGPVAFDSPEIAIVKGRLCSVGRFVSIMRGL